MKLSSPSGLKRFRKSRWWGVIVNVILYGICLSIFLYPFFIPEWSFTKWLSDVFSAVKWLPFPVAIIFLFVAWVIRTGEDTPTDDPLDRMSYKYDRLKEAYGYMRGAALAGLIGFLILWLIIRHKL
jgi:hypothetical protein